MQMKRSDRLLNCLRASLQACMQLLLLLLLLLLAQQMTAMHSMEQQAP